MLPSGVKKSSQRRIPARSGMFAVVFLGLAAILAGCGSSTRTTSTSASSSQSGASTASQAVQSGGGGSSSGAVATDVALTLRSSEYGKVVSDVHHRVLYIFAADRGPKSNCYGECAAAWPPLLTKGTPTAGTGLNAKLLGTTKRNDGSLQVTYDGHPLYYYSGDTGEHIMCQHVKLHGGFWYVVNAGGTANMAMGHGMMSMGHKTSMSHGSMKSH